MLLKVSQTNLARSWDNATSESFFSTLKRELVELHNFADQQQAAAAIFEYIEVFYNKIRLHSTTLISCSHTV
ncbi:MAG: hypothetical protein COA94_03330 [Rickettsiales bacterium]|nr:MAG: hypothetical protein COA94_03330 [Rickettsiales bacterium]